MIEIIDDLPEHIKEAIELGSSSNIKYAGVNSVCIAGMGGSSIGGELLVTLSAKHSRLPFSLVRDYDLPRFVGKKTLTIIVSYSGNTEESLSLLSQAKDRSKILCVSSDGVIEDQAKKENLPLLSIPKGYPPRAALAFLFFPVLEILNRSGIMKIQKEDIEETVQVLSENKETAKVWAEEVSGKLKEKLPFIYSIYDFRAVARRWSTQINENAKSLAHWAFFSELDHNEIVGWENPQEILKRSFILILRDRDEDDRIKRRIEITSELIEGFSGEIMNVYSEGDSELAKLFSLIQKGDYLSIYLAENYKIDPLPIKRIQELKRRLAE
ncbi:MAG: bifunctional phosphoglucose/phosphomannose isomerase [candidate division WOR-3 bacterium]|nr:bifunctional phosphoglucose/phosphomannose isomerase [candidate division WOR-3 bacterium]